MLGKIHFFALIGTKYAYALEKMHLFLVSNF